MEVRQAYVEVRAAGLVLGPPKSRAGIRTVSFPPFLRAPLRQHLIDVADDPEAFVFTTETGRPIWRCNFNKLVGWQAAVAGIGRPGLHFHDLRHTDNTLAADSGTSLRNYPPEARTNLRGRRWMTGRPTLTSSMPLGAGARKVTGELVRQDMP